MILYVRLKISNSAGKALYIAEKAITTDMII